jgi:large subunit ribosomal protein L15e
MGMYKYVREAWKKPKENLKEFWMDRMVLWRKQPSTLRIKRPTRIDRARSLGYKAKEGIIVIRQRVKRGARMKPKPAGGRRPKRFGKSYVLRKNYQLIAEERANKKFINCEVLNSYHVAEDGMHKWFEVILVDTSNPSIKADKNLRWMASKKHTGRAYRGLTSAGRKVRGLRHKGKGAEKARPSRRANKRRI